MNAIGRRGFVVSTLSSGFALAVTPAATAITTDATGLEAGEVKIPVPGGEIPGYRAKPAKGSAFPVVLVIQEIFGVHEHMRDVCRRLAKLGYLAIAPELYARQGDVSKIAEVKDIVEQVVSKVPDAQVFADLDAALAFAGKDGGDASRAAAIGFCWGGRQVWMYSAHNPFLRAGVAFYGRFVAPPHELRPKNPLDIAPTLKVSVLGLYGEKDEGIPQETVERMKKSLPTEAPHSEIVVYPGAQHGFFADYRPSYKKDAAEDAWKRLKAWLKAHGV